MDGTLVDTEPLKAKALSKTCGIFGNKVNPDIYKVVMGESWSNVSSYFFKTAQIEPNVDEFNAKFRKIYQELLRNQLSLNSNAKELLVRLRELGKKVGLVSSAFKWMVNQVLTQVKLVDFFDVLITQEDVIEHKPNPEAYLLALKRLSVCSSEVLIFEDSNAGLTAANKANCDAVAFKHEFNTNNDLSLAIKVISDFNEIRV